MLVDEMQLTIDKGHESTLVSLDFSRAFDIFNHTALIFKLQSIGGKNFKYFN